MRAAYVGIDILYPALTSLYDTGCEIVKIFSCKTDNVTEFNIQTTGFAKDHDIPLQMERITQKDLEELANEGVSFVLVGGYYHVIPVIESLRIVNTHPALLPYGRGAWPGPVTILKGLTESGITLHQMEKELDTGRIILQKKVPVYDDDDLWTLTKRQWSVIPGMVKELVADFDRLWNEAVPQAGNIEYWEMPTEDDYTVTSDMDFKQADIILRAFKGYECIYINKDDNTRKEIIDAAACRDVQTAADGVTILPIKDGAIICERIRDI